MKRLLIFSMVLGLMAGAVETSAAHGVETGRSGTIVTGAWWDAYLDGATGCDTAPECRAWVGSGCQPALTGRGLTERDPALMASIEDVADLAEEATSWRFDWENGYSDNAGWVVVQLWREDCTEIRSKKWCSVSGCNPYAAPPIFVGRQRICTTPYPLVRKVHDRHRLAISSVARTVCWRTPATADHRLDPHAR
jgi:hypothetical protein